MCSLDVIGISTDIVRDIPCSVDVENVGEKRTALGDNRHGTLSVLRVLVEVSPDMSIDGNCGRGLMGLRRKVAKSFVAFAVEVQKRHLVWTEQLIQNIEISFSFHQELEIIQHHVVG